MKDTFTEFRRVGQTLQWLTTIAEQVNVGIVVTDLNGIACFVNTAMARMHGYLSRKDLIGKKISVFHSEDQMNTDVLPMIEEVKRRGLLLGPIEHLRNDGNLFPTQTKMILLKDGEDKAVGLVVFVTDISKHTQMEKSLAKRDIELVTAKDRLEQLTEQVEDLTSKLAATKEQLHQLQIDRHKQAEESLNEQASELTATNENLQQQVFERQQMEEQLQHQVIKLEQAGQELNGKAAECRELEEVMKENTEKAYELKDSKLPRQHVLNEEKLQSLAELAKCLYK